MYRCDRVEVTGGTGLTEGQREVTGGIFRGYSRFSAGTLGVIRRNIQV